jgi:hypothetical protein
MKKSFGNSLGKKIKTSAKKPSNELPRVIGQEPYQLKGQFAQVLSQKNGKNTEYYFFKNKGDVDPAVIEIYQKPKHIPYPTVQIITEACGLGSRPINFVDMARDKRTSDYEESAGFSGSKVKLSADDRGSFNRVLRMSINQAIWCVKALNRSHRYAFRTFPAILLGLYSP